MAIGIDNLQRERKKNIAQTERYLSVLCAVALASPACRNRGVLSSIVSIYLFYRGLSGCCPIGAAFNLRDPAKLRPDLVQKFGDGTRDLVEEASWESFPASDPPAF